MMKPPAKELESVASQIVGREWGGKRLDMPGTGLLITYAPSQGHGCRSGGLSFEEGNGWTLVDGEHYGYQRHPGR